MNEVQNQCDLLLHKNEELQNLVNKTNTIKLQNSSTVETEQKLKIQTEKLETFKQTYILLCAENERLHSIIASLFEEKQKE